MKKNMVPKLIFLLLIVILIVCIVIAITKKEKDFTLKMYNDICNMENYTFSLQVENDDENYDLTVSKQKENMCIDVKSKEEDTSTLIKDKTAYYVMHADKEYYIYDSEEIDADIIKNGLSEIDGKSYTSGHEKINGKNYYYEEYDGISTFFIVSKYDDDNDIKTRFYFENGNIRYIKTTSKDVIELLKVNFTKDVNSNVFEIPNDYAESKKKVYS